MSDWSFEEGGKAGTAFLNYALSSGTAMRALAATHTKAGSLSRIDILPDFDSELALFTVRLGQQTGNLMDIGMGTMPAHVIIENLLSVQEGDNALHHYLFPIAFPARQTLYGRNQGPSQGNIGPDVGVRVFSRGIASFPIAGSIVRSYGVVTASATRGTATDPGAVTNAKGAWVQLGILTERGIYINVGSYANVNSADLPAWLLDIGIGPAGSEKVLLPNLPFSVMSGSFIRQVQHVHGPFPINLPTGTRIAARLQCDSNKTGSRELDIAAFVTS